MALELMVTPLETKPVEWNYEELKSAVATKLQDYTGLVYTESQMKEAKADRAKLRKLKQALDDKRKEVKKQINQPYAVFEGQIKEVMELIDKPIGMIDGQIKEHEEAERAAKRVQIEETWKKVSDDGITYNFVTLADVQKDEWLNKSYSITKIEEEIRSRMMQIGNDIATINLAGENAAVALEAYKQSKDLNQALQKMHEFEHLQKLQKEKEEASKAAEIVENADTAPVSALPDEPSQEEQEEVVQKPREPQLSPGKRMRVTFEVTANESQFGYLNQILQELVSNSEKLVITKREELW